VAAEANGRAGAWSGLKWHLAVQQALTGVLEEPGCALAAALCLLVDSSERLSASSGKHGRMNRAWHAERARDRHAPRTPRASRPRLTQPPCRAADMQARCQGAYSASKAALNLLSEALRRELHPFGIRVVVIKPGASALRLACYWRLTRAAHQHP
jgi:hypothetical protein